MDPAPHGIRNEAVDSAPDTALPSFVARPGPSHPQRLHQETTMDVDPASPVPRSAAQFMSNALSHDGAAAFNEFGFYLLGGLGLGQQQQQQQQQQPQPPPVQGSSTITPSSVLSNGSDRDMYSSSLGGEVRYLAHAPDSDLLHPYLPTSLSRPFGSLSDIQALALDNDYGLGIRDSTTTQHTIERSASDMDISKSQGSGVHALSSPRHAGTSPMGPFGMYRSPERLARDGIHLDSSGSSLNVGRGLGASATSSSSSSSASYLPSSIELLPSSFSPLLLQYDTHGSIVVDTSGNATDGNTTGDGLSFVLSGLSAGNELSFDDRERDRRRTAGELEVGIEPMRVMKDLGGAGGVGRTESGLRRGGGGVQYSSVPMSLPIPTRSRHMPVLGWQGEKLEEGRRSGSTLGDCGSVQGNVGGNRGGGSLAVSRKRKRSNGTDSEVEGDEKIERSMRREMLGLRQVSVDSGFGEDEEPEERRERKRRRLGSVSGSKGKEREVWLDWEGSEDDSDEDDEDDAYSPSRSPSPATYGGWKNAGPSSRPVERHSTATETRSNSSRSRSTRTRFTASTNTSSSYSRECKDEEKGSIKRRRNKGKAKGSAALALAQATMMSGKSPTSAWGTYVPYPFKEYQEEQRSSVEYDSQVRTGRRRRNGHIPLPEPVPHLIKKSRGRKVPFVAEKMVQGTGESESSTRRRDGEEWKRVYVCKVPGCGKCFVRGEHLKRHVRSIHTNDKPHPCPFEGCDKTFSRRDNLGQHVRIHLEKH